MHQDSRQGFSIVNPLIVASKTEHVTFFASSTFFKIKVLNLTDVIKSPYTETLTYDKCVLSLMSQQEIIDINFLNPKEEIIFTSGLKSDYFENIERNLFLNTQSSFCKYLINSLQVKYTQEQLNKYWNIQKNTDSYLSPSLRKPIYHLDFFQYEISFFAKTKKIVNPLYIFF